jgi:hypothetical protein
VSLLPLDQGVKGAVALITLPAKIETAVCADQRVPATDKPPSRRKSRLPRTSAISLSTPSRSQGEDPQADSTAARASVRRLSTPTARGRSRIRHCAPVRHRAAPSARWSHQRKCRGVPNPASTGSCRSSSVALGNISPVTQSKTKTRTPKCGGAAPEGTRTKRTVKSPSRQ